MKIVRNTCYTWLHVNRPLQDAAELTRTFSLPILALPIQKKLYSKTTTALCCERRWRSSRRIFVKSSSFCANSKGCPTERSQISPACLQAPWCRAYRVHGVAFVMFW